MPIIYNYTNDNQISNPIANSHRYQLDDATIKILNTTNKVLYRMTDDDNNNDADIESMKWRIHYVSKITGKKGYSEETFTYKEAVHLVRILNEEHGNVMYHYLEPVFNPPNQLPSDFWT